MRQPKLLFVVNAARYFLSHRLALALAAQQAGYAIHVAVPSSEQSAVIEAYGFKLHPLPLRRASVNPLRELKSWWALLQLLRTLRPDLLHLVSLKACLYGGIAARFVKLKSIHVITGLGFVFCDQRIKSRFIRRLIIWGFRFLVARESSFFIFQNRDDQALFVQERMITAKQAYLIKGSGVRLDQYYPQAQKNALPIVMLPARMLSSKGVEDFVLAAQQINQQSKLAQFVLVGPLDNENPAAISAAMIESWVKQAGITWWGHCEDMLTTLNQADIVCLPVRFREGLPRVLIEAAACAKPIVASDVAGCNEIVRHEQNGLLVPVGDVQALMTALRRLLSDATLRAQMGEQGRCLVEQEFSMAIVNQATLQLYATALGRQIAAEMTSKTPVDSLE